LDQPGFTHQLVATVRNNGEGLASGFDGGCEWDCSWGQNTHAGADIVRGGYISGNSQYTYKQPLNVQCEGSPTTLYFDVQLIIITMSKKLMKTITNGLGR
jgi:hypothetical protein